MLLEPCLAAERLDVFPGGDLLQVWELARGRVRAWRVTRRLDPVRRVVECERRPDPADPDVALPAAPGVCATPGPALTPPAPSDALASPLRGAPPARVSDAVPDRAVRAEEYAAGVVRSVWRVTEAGPDACVVRLERSGAECVGRGRCATALRREVRAAVRTVARAAVSWERWDELLVGWEEGVVLGGPPEVAYQVVAEAGAWPDAVSGAVRAEVAEPATGVQVAVTEWAGRPGDGGVGVFGSVRLAFAGAGRVVEKDVVRPAGLAASAGSWSLVPDAAGTRLVRWRGVLLDPDAVLRQPRAAADAAGAGPSQEPSVDARAAELGPPEAPLAVVRDEVRSWLSRADREVLALAEWRAGSVLRHVG
ncbi:hypothetical protein WN71_009395 [Streptomyces mangrovisoli]|uniref:Uncharacterized protein n=1 Tax=Streptomyces mangrovisoli TaxID=1428628 RepID=A0A1J4P096_9ACTN|nr:hypothetical protein WN71_009395 [Streptomyces mangrovisoli]